MKNDLEIYGELLSHYKSAGNQNEYVFFLRYCAKRLNEGASVETIWNEWTEGKA